MMTRLALLILAGSTLSVRAEDLPTLKVGEEKIPSQLTGDVAKLLAAECYSISEDDKVALKFWMRKEIPSSAPPDSLIDYSSVAEGTLIGAVEVIDDTFTDFRGQDLHPGVYTLRVASHPQDGNHMGIAFSPTFACLVPAEEDKSAEPIKRDDLMELSKKAAQTGHPCALFLEPWFEAPQHKLPTIRKNELEHIVLDVQPQAQLDSGLADFPVAIVFIGETDAE